MDAVRICVKNLSTILSLRCIPEKAARDSSIKPQTIRGNGNCLSSGKKPQLSREQLKADQRRRCCLPPTRCSHAFSLRQARPPACIVAGSFGARRGALRGRPSPQHVPASLFGNGRPGPERRSGRGQSQAQLTDTYTHTLTLAHCHPPPLFFTQTLLVFSLLSSPLPLLSSLQGSEITA
ncbi:hypothetical protein Q7C36_011506 [Tachysurus vachellii]|uniref:Uncharacterized protein n=1 Tax=Tachysurus vachellii TaxID=175792 RepID=A0AA88MRC4_TACVA|nr:hypothetical protein Q7C36_011506 [Tachysurus vachellii]